jgi:hypothetical protein
MICLRLWVTSFDSSAFWICLLTDCCVSAKLSSSYAGHGICPGYDGAHVVVNPMKMRKGSIDEPGRVRTKFVFGQMIRICTVQNYFEFC